MKAFLQFLVLFAMIGLAACGGATPPATPAAAPTASFTPTSTDSPAPTASPTPTVKPAPSLPPELLDRHPGGVTTEMFAGAFWAAYDNEGNPLAWYDEAAQAWQIPEAGQALHFYHQELDNGLWGPAVGAVLLDVDQSASVRLPSQEIIANNQQKIESMGQAQFSVSFDNLNIAGWKVEQITLNPGKPDEAAFNRAFFKFAYHLDGKKHILVVEKRWRWFDENRNLFYVEPEVIKQNFPIGSRVHINFNTIPPENTTTTNDKIRQWIEQKGFGLLGMFGQGCYGDKRLSGAELEQMLGGDDLVIFLPFDLVKLNSISKR